MESQLGAEEMDTATGVKNPLQRIDLRDTIHRPINEHATLHHGFFDPSLYPGYKLDYFCQFLLGIFVSIRNSPNSNLKDIYMRPYKIDKDGDSLRIFAVFNDLIVLHDIQNEGSSWGPERKMMTEEEYSLLKDLIKDGYDLAIGELDIKYKQYGAGLTEPSGYFQMNIKHEVDVQVRDGTLDGKIRTRMVHRLLDQKEISSMIVRNSDVELLEISGHSWFSDTFTSNYKKSLSSFYMLEEGITDANRIFKRLNNPHHALYESGAKASFMHGLLSGSMPDHYYNEALQFTNLKGVFVQGPSSLILIPPIHPTDSKCIIIDFRDIKNIHEDYTIASRIGVHIELHLWRPSVEMGEIFTLRKEIIKWSSANIISNLVKHINNFQSNGNLKALEAEKISYLDLLDTKRTSYKSISGSKPDLRKYFFLGEFLTSLDEKFHINGQTANEKKLDAILINHDDTTKVLLTFHAKGPISERQGLRSVVHRGDFDVIGINFGENRPLMYTMSLNCAIKLYVGFQTVLPIKLNELFNEISFSDNSKVQQHSVLFRLFMDDMLRGVRNFAENADAMKVYFCGAFSRLMKDETLSIGAQSGGRLININIKTAKKLRYQLHILLLNDATKQTFPEAMDLARRKISLYNYFCLAYNFATITPGDHLSIAAVAVNGNDRQLIEPYTSKKVLRRCKDLPGRAKRVSATSIICPKGKKGQRGDKRTSYQELEKRLAKKHPHLHNHVTKIYKIATRIQTAMIGGSMLSHLLRGDLKAFAIDVAFLGAAVYSPYAAERIAKWGEEKAVKLVEKASKSKGIIQTVIKKIGWRIATVGRCLPTLGFTAFSAYQLHQEIKNNDMVSAAITGTSLAIDLIGCGFEAAAAVGLLTISPIIVQIGAIVSTALAIGQNVYSGFQQTREISEVIPLTLTERVYSFKRSLLPWLDADPTLKSITDQVITNEQAVKMAFDMFPEAKKFVLSAGIKIDDKTREVYLEDSTIRMTKKRKVQVSRAMPRPGQIGEEHDFFCAMDEKDLIGKKELEEKISWSRIATLGGPEVVIAIIDHVTRKKVPEVLDYHCINALGVKKKNSSSNDTTVFLLHNGTDNVVGFPNSPNVMILGDGKKEIHGGEKEDRFMMIGNHAYGYLDGGSGEDVIDFSEYAKKPLMIMNFENSTISLSSGNRKFAPLIVKNFETFIGRANLTDHVKVCNHTHIDLSGTGSTFDADTVIISHSEQCQPIINLTVHLKNNTNVVCDAENSTVVYIVNRDSTNAIDIPVGSHHFIFNLVTLTEVRATINYTLLTMFIGSTGQLVIRTGDEADLKFTFNSEKIRMTLNGSKLIARVTNTASIYETVENYASYLDKNPVIELIAETSHGNIKLSHNHSTIENNGVQSNLNIVFLDDKTTDQKLIAHSDGENYFLIQKKLQNQFNETVYGPLKITIDSTSAKKFVSYLDMKYFCTAREGNSDYDIRMMVVQNGANIIITLVAVAVNKSDGLDETEMGTVTIVDGISYMDQIRIHLWSESRIVNSSNELVIRPIPIHVNQHGYSIHPDQFEFNSAIYFNYEIGNLEAYSVNNTLVITDVAILENPEKNRVIMTFIEYHVYKRKYETLILIFKNREIHLDASSELVKRAVDISLLWEKMNEEMDFVEEEEGFQELRENIDKVGDFFSLRPE